jgi:DnaJ family protein C protein 11
MISVDEELDEVFLHVPSPKLSDLAVRYSFVAPFPTLRAVLGENEKEDAEDADEKKTQDDANGEPELEIYAGVSGGLQRFFNEVELEYEDGETELRKVAFSRCLLATSHC